MSFKVYCALVWVSI